ncbi:MAG: endopeptidase La [Cytophagales bacterium]|nr:endopeptidase La [Cytophagales bacterium]
MAPHQLDEEPMQPNPSANGAGNNLVLVSDVLPDRLTILPLRDRPIFPGLTLPILLSGRQYLEALRLASDNQPTILGVSLVQDPNEEDLFASTLYRVGTAIKIFRINPMGNDTVQVIAQGISRFECVRKVGNTGPAPRWEVKYRQDPDEKPNDELKAYTLAIIASVKEILAMNPIFQEQLKVIVSQLSSEKPGRLMDAIASMLTVEAGRVQEVLEAFHLFERGFKLMMLLREERELLQLQQKINQQVEQQMSKQQREFMLRQQLKAIKQELGLEKDDKSAEVERIEARLGGKQLSEEAARIVRTELDRLAVLEPASPEFNVIRTYLDVLTDLPWGHYAEDNRDIRKARQILDAEHFGLEDVKERILAFISTIIRRGRLTGTNLLLVGPPGVGKTSIGRSVASALGRPFYRFSVGGMRDEAEIKGHRRTYIGALPGKLIDSLRRTGVSNPVIMLDELDKMGSSYQGDPAAALLEVLDPEQNRNFLDNYLDVRYDLSNVLFIATANQLDTIPEPLLDRMEVIRLSGYVLEEKVAIARSYLIPRQREEHGLLDGELEITDEGLRTVIDRYAREAGVRNLEKQIQKIMRHVTLKLAEGAEGQFRVTPDTVADYLGKPTFTNEILYNKGVPGTVLGLAYTAMGGATLYIEANAVRSRSSGFKQTGQLGKVMQESSEIAYSYIRARTGDDPAMKVFFDEHVVHLHVPAGATPKDGPSAGVTMALALYSLAAGKPVRAELAMTGEISLTGKVLPIGGVREKTIAARRVGITEIILPEENRKDFEELPPYIRDGMTVHYADHFDDVAGVAFAVAKQEG